MHAVDRNKYLTDVPFDSDGGAQNANPKMQGSGLPGSVGGLHREEGALSTALGAETHAFYPQPLGSPQNNRNPASGFRNLWLTFEANRTSSSTIWL